MADAPKPITSQNYYRIAGYSYLAIFFLAVYANFFMIESLTVQPLATVQEHPFLVRSGSVAFLAAALFDVLVAWALYALYKNNPLTNLSTWLRIIHAILMGTGVLFLFMVFEHDTAAEIRMQVTLFNTLWLIGLFFFGFHLFLLQGILDCPKWIRIFLMLAGIMYVTDTLAHFLLPDYENYQDLMLTLVALPSVLGELSLTIWLLLKSRRAKY